jgi:hypothetical protein
MLGAKVKVAAESLSGTLQKTVTLAEELLARNAHP